LLINPKHFHLIDKVKIFAIVTVKKLNKIVTILFLISFLIFIFPINTSKSIAKQFSIAMSSEEEDGMPKGFDIHEFNIKLLPPIKYFDFNNDIFYLLSKERFTHYLHHTFPVDWLETFSPPPDVA